MGRGTELPCSLSMPLSPNLHMFTNLRVPTRHFSELSKYTGFEISHIPNIFPYVFMGGVIFFYSQMYFKVLSLLSCSQRLSWSQVWTAWEAEIRSSEELTRNPHVYKIFKFLNVSNFLIINFFYITQADTVHGKQNMSVDQIRLC